MEFLQLHKYSKIPIEPLNITEKCSNIPMAISPSIDTKGKAKQSETKEVLQP